MSFPLQDMLAVAANGPVARVVVADTRGSVPREKGAAMIVSSDAVIGTIGGGALEYEAIATARQALAERRDRLDRRPLGPQLGQCCGGSVTLLTEVWDIARLTPLQGEVVARPTPGTVGAMPLAVRRRLSVTRSQGIPPEPGLVGGWMIEPVSRPARSVWIWGAGHVGRALVAVLSPLPDFALTWIDTSRDRFPANIAAGVSALLDPAPARLASLAPDAAEHLVLTYSHALDLEICHNVLSREFRFLGLIGSATKRARFRSRLAALGHGPALIDRMTCPIGDRSLGKHPQAIALGVATGLLRMQIRGTDLKRSNG